MKWSRRPLSGDVETRLRQSYDQLPYVSEAQLHSHPDHLAALGRLAGLETASPEACRVLEIGCGDGGNLLPMAWYLRSSQFLGLDLSPVQIEAGCQQARALGLDNLELRVESILDLADDGTPFDYILVHGVFSWVDEMVQERILALCGNALAPHGVALVTYNTLPGWHLRTLVRDLMLHHTREIEDPLEKVRQGVAWVELLAEHLGRGNDEQAALLRGARAHLAELSRHPSHIFHEYFEENNRPIYFEDFVSRAEAHGLQYLGDAEQELARPANLDPLLAERLAPLAEDRLAYEQSLDFLVNRAFRRSLLCRAGRKLDHPPSTERVPELWVASPVEPGGEAHDPATPERLEFRLPTGRTFSTTHPLAKAVLVTLAQVWPSALDFESLVVAVGEELGQGVAAGNGGTIDSPQVDRVIVADIVASSFFSGVVDLHAAAPRCAHRADERPRVFELVRHQLTHGFRVTNPRHQIIELDDAISQLLVRWLDGSRDRAALLDLLAAEAEAGRLGLEHDGLPVHDPGEQRRLLVPLLEKHLRRLARFGLLEEG